MFNIDFAVGVFHHIYLVNVWGICCSNGRFKKVCGATVREAQVEEFCDFRMMYVLFCYGVSMT